jgi:hypothetical protein
LSNQHWFDADFCIEPVFLFDDSSRRKPAHLFMVMLRETPPRSQSQLVGAEAPPPTHWSSASPKRQLRALGGFVYSGAS